jgi:hypothetical protein
MNRIKNPQTLISLGMFSLAFGNIAGWVMRQHTSAPFWADSGDFIMGLGVGTSIALILLGLRMKNRPAC